MMKLMGIDGFGSTKGQIISECPYETSLKIFKHYKLKPSFSIIEDEKAKDKVGWGTSPHPQVSTI